MTVLHRIWLLSLWLLALTASLTTIPMASAAGDFDSLYAEIKLANRNGSGAIALSGDVVLTAPLPPIAGEIVIDGGGHTISGAGKYRIFDVGGGRFEIRDLTLTEGKSAEGGALRLRNGVAAWVTGVSFRENMASTGGAIMVQGVDSRLTIHNSDFAANQAEHHAGAIVALSATVRISGSSFTKNSAGLYGGAIVAQSGNIHLMNSTLHGNWVRSSGGAIRVVGGEVTLTHVTMTDNFSMSDTGNAIERQDGIVSLRNSIIASSRSGNDCDNGWTTSVGNLSKDGSCGYSASGDPGLGELVGRPAWRPLKDGSPAIDAADPEYCPDVDQRGEPRPAGAGCDIGAIESKTAAAQPEPIEPPPPCPLDLKIIAANTDAPAGGCPAGSGHDVITLDRDITLTASLPLIASDITIRGNGYTISGNGRYRVFHVIDGKLSIKDLTITRASNSRINSPGAAILLEADGELEVNNSVFSRNYAGQGGAIGSKGGGISLTVRNSRFIENVGGSGGAISMNGGYAVIRASSFVRNKSLSEGGAIKANSGTVQIENSTFINNQATYYGGALSVLDASVTLTNVTMIGSTAATGDVIYVEPRMPGVVKLRNSAVAGRSPAADCHGHLAQNVGNLIEDGSCLPMLSGDPMIAEVADSATWLGLQAGSPAIGAADTRFCPDTDQSGSPRPQGGGCDIGAIEWSVGGAAKPDTGSAPREPSACTVTTTEALNFRDGPGGSKIGLVAKDAAVTALARTEDWFQVEYRSRTGWISADFVKTEGACG